MDIQTGGLRGRSDVKSLKLGFSHDPTSDASECEAQASRHNYPSTTSRRRSRSAQCIDDCRGEYGKVIHGHLHGCLADRGNRPGLKNKHYLLKTRRAFFREAVLEQSNTRKRKPLYRMANLPGEIRKSATVCLPYRQEAEGSREYGARKSCRRQIRKFP